MKPIFLTIVTAAICSADQKIKLEDMPAAVQVAVKEQSKGATVRGYSKEVEHGKTFYEAELSVNGHDKDVSFDASGKVVSVEEETPIDSVPSPARDAIQKAVGTGKLQRVETVSENGRISYEAAIKIGTKTREVTFDPEGKRVK